MTSQESHCSLVQTVAATFYTAAISVATSIPSRRLQIPARTQAKAIKRRLQLPVHLHRPSIGRAIMRGVLCAFLPSSLKWQDSDANSSSTTSDLVMCSVTLTGVPELLILSDPAEPCEKWQWPAGDCQHSGSGKNGGSGKDGGSGNNSGGLLDVVDGAATSLLPSPQERASVSVFNLTFETSDLSLERRESLDLPAGAGSLQLLPQQQQEMQWWSCDVGDGDGENRDGFCRAMPPLRRCSRDPLPRLLAALVAAPTIHEEDEEVEGAAIGLADQALSISSSDGDLPPPGSCQEDGLLGGATPAMRQASTAPCLASPAATHRRPPLQCLPACPPVGQYVCAGSYFRRLNAA